MSEPYAVAWSPTARRQLTRLPEKVGPAVVEFVYGALAENRQRAGHPLRLGLAGLHSARRGDYRVVHGMVEDARTVTIRVIEHRSGVYRHCACQRLRSQREHDHYAVPEILDFVSAVGSDGPAYGREVFPAELVDGVWRERGGQLCGSHQVAEQDPAGS